MIVHHILYVSIKLQQADHVYYSPLSAIVGVYFSNLFFYFLRNKQIIYIGGGMHNIFIYALREEVLRESALFWPKVYNLANSFVAFGGGTAIF